ncbi:phasin family protein [Acinetobacter sp. CFCC 10889]|uniref:phasin family protein n=1 Tax=Acinetobacter sp. CFCC 10889 TaxID=1775557 RepID=UPI000DCFF9AA|nr:phasin family protein [Acinetobacter sp. CFCC 10889]
MDLEQQESQDDLKLNSTKEKTQIKEKSSRKSPLDFRKYTKQIWLAGLGAFSRAEEEGNKLFDSLVKVGEELESKSVEDTEVEQSAKNVVEKTKETVTETKEKVEKTLDHHVNHSLNRIGLVTAKDLQHLETLILQLHQKVDGLVEENQKLSDQLQKIVSQPTE